MEIPSILVTGGTPNILLQYCCTAIKRGLNLTDAQCFIAVADTFDPDWVGPTTVLVIPGATSPDGSGHGAQEGGAVFRRQYIRFVTYKKCMLDQYSLSQTSLTQATVGLMDFFESLRQLFKFTQFGINGVLYSNLLTDIFRYEGESATAWVENNGNGTGIVRRDLTYSGPYGEILPNEVTLTIGDVT